MEKTIYNEDIYLFNPEKAKQFKDIYQRKKQEWEKEETLFSEELKKYDEFVEEVAMLLKKLGFHSSLECSTLLSHMIRLGYLSHNLEYDGERINPSEEIDSSLGTTIIRGNGCCRNIAKIHQDVYDKLKIPSQQLYCYDGPRFIFGLDRNPQANHAINLVQHNDNYYGIDLYNGNRLFRFASPLVMKSLSSCMRETLLYKPYYEIIVGESDIEQIKEKLKRFEEASHKPVISSIIYEDEIDFISKHRIKKQKNLMNDFHEKTKQLKKEIKEGIEKKIYK